MRVTLIIFLMGLICCNKTVAQVDPVFGFDASVYNGNVILNWSIEQGNTCFGILIERSSDGLNYNQIGSIPGVCGSTSASESYSFTDQNPIKNKINYYRLNLGGLFYSHSTSVDFIDLSINNYRLKPNPVISTARINFSNPNKKSMEFVLYDFSGIEIERFTTINDYVDTKATLVNGTYFFLIYDDNELLVRGKFVKI